MTADVVPMEMHAVCAGENKAIFSWRKELFLAATLVIVTIVSAFSTSWYLGRDIRPLPLAGFVLYLTVAFGLGLRRRWLNARYPQTSSHASKFSLAELMIYVTAFVFFIGFLQIDRLASQQIQRDRERLQVAAAGLLGPDGRVSFMSDGSLQIAICDRTFDDARLTRLAKKISQWKADTKIIGVMFGSGANTNNTPPVWPAITDQSVPLLMQWQELELLAVYGTAISGNGREQLRSLPHLNEPSQHMLAK